MTTSTCTITTNYADIVGAFWAWNLDKNAAAGIPLDGAAELAQAEQDAALFIQHLLQARK